VNAIFLTIICVEQFRSLQQMTDTSKSPRNLPWRDFSEMLSRLSLGSGDIGRADGKLERSGSTNPKCPVSNEKQQLKLHEFLFPLLIPSKHFLYHELPPFFVP
jgi:hypothetical protein